MINRLYKALLWLLGFLPGETITKMLRRQKARWGVWWWVVAIGSLTGAIGAIGAGTWLIFHVIGLC